MKRNTIPLLVLFVCTIWACKKATVRMEGYQVHGIDVSHHQGKIAWEVIGSLDYDFVFVKATEGETHQDSNFIKNWDAIAQTKLYRGAYHFFRPKIPVNNQVDNYLTMVNLRTGDLPPVLDVEVTDKLNGKMVADSAFAWLCEVERRTGVKPILYTYQKFFNKHLKNNRFDFPIWIARYNTSPPALHHEAHWDFWQYGNRGEIEGIDGYVDFNVFNGPKSDLDKLRICLEKTP